MISAWDEDIAKIRELLKSWQPKKVARTDPPKEAEREPKPINPRMAFHASPYRPARRYVGGREV